MKPTSVGVFSVGRVVSRAFLVILRQEPYFDLELAAARRWRCFSIDRQNYSALLCGNSPCFPLSIWSHLVICCWLLRERERCLKPIAGTNRDPNLRRHCCCQKQELNWQNPPKHFPEGLFYCYSTKQTRVYMVSRKRFSTHRTISCQSLFLCSFFFQESLCRILRRLRRRRRRRRRRQTWKNTPPTPNTSQLLLLLFLTYLQGAVAPVSHKKSVSPRGFFLNIA